LKFADELEGQADALERKSSPATLGDVLYAKSKQPVARA